MLVFLFITQLQSQCIIDAGINRNVCLDESIAGASLYGEVISGDVVQFTWEAMYYEPTLDKTYYASIMLSDTTVLQPTIEQHFKRTTKYHLTGRTSTGESCKDSVELNFSDWFFLTIDKATGKSPSDTIGLWIAAESNWPHIKYEWTPNYMISDTTIQNPKVWNDTTVFYKLQITDSIGCTVMDDVFEVYVTSNVTKEPDENMIKVYPNPTTGILNIDSRYTIESYALFDLKGKLLISSHESQMDLSNTSDGIYILQINSVAGEAYHRKVIKGNKP